MKNDKPDKSIDNSELNEHNDDLIVEATDDGGEIPTDEESAKRLREKLKLCVEEKQEYLLGWQRAKADYVNARKADDASKKDFVRFARSELIEDLIPVVESFEQAFSNKEAWGKVSRDWRVGVEYIYQKLINTLNKHGLSETNPIGEIFNPLLHTSIESIKTTNKNDEHKIIEVVQKGYNLNGKILKPPNVKVAVLDGDIN